MDGIFIRKKTNAWHILLLLCGIFFIALYIFLNIVDSEATSELLAFLIFGILLSFFAIPSMLLNHGAYIRIEENFIHAKYHWFSSIDCNIDEVAFVLPQINTLTILLKNGKRHVIMGVENSWPLSSVIRRQNFSFEAESPIVLRQKLDHVQAVRKKELWWVLGGITLMFANIFIAVLLTGGKDLHEFGKLDWILFAVMGFIELLTLIGLFYAAGRCGKHLVPIEQLKYRLRGAMIASQPLPSNNIKNVYTDENHTGRIIVCGFPNDESVYYCVQEFAGNFELETVHTSEIYDNKDELPEDGFSTLIDVTSRILSL